MVAGLVDANVIIDELRKYPPAETWLQGQNYLGISRAVYLEVIQGAVTKIEQRRAIKLMNRFQFIELIDADFKWATDQLIRFNLSHNIDAFDCLIAAPAHRLQLPLYTRNLKHFAPLLGNLAQQPY